MQHVVEALGGANQGVAVAAGMLAALLGGWCAGTRRHGSLAAALAQLEASLLERTALLEASLSSQIRDLRELQRDFDGAKTQVYPVKAPFPSLPVRTPEPKTALVDFSLFERDEHARG